jgi:hypothetical protein
MLPAEMLRGGVLVRTKTRAGGRAWSSEGAEGAGRGSGTYSRNDILVVREVGFAVLAAIDLGAVQVDIVGEAHLCPTLPFCALDVMFCLLACFSGPFLQASAVGQLQLVDRFNPGS